MRKVDDLDMCGSPGTTMQAFRYRNPKDPGPQIRPRSSQSNAAAVGSRVGLTGKSLRTPLRPAQLHSRFGIFSHVPTRSSRSWQPKLPLPAQHLGGMARHYRNPEGEKTVSGRGFPYDVDVHGTTWETRGLVGRRSPNPKVMIGAFVGWPG